MTALDDLKIYLTTTLASAYGDLVLTEVLDTEIQDQANKIRSRYRMTDPVTDWVSQPKPLREAVMRRCARNLAARKMPLGVEASEFALIRLASKDSEINRLEGPYRRASVG